jgi:hypothetical protein
MWPRVSELLVAIWLLAAPSLLPGEGGESWSIALGVLALAFTLMAFTRRLRWTHMATLILGLFMMIWPMTRPMPLSPVMQSIEICGWLLAMFAVIPSRSNQPPERWKKIIAIREDQGLEG